MNKIILALLICLATKSALGQDTNAANKNAPVMTTAFFDSIKNQISRIMPAHYTMKLNYTSPISAEGKLLKPMIMREACEKCDEADNEFVVKLQLLIKDAPAWQPALDKSQDKNIDDIALFYIFVKKGKITMGTNYNGEGKF